MEVKQIEFSKLRHAYVTVKNFLEKDAEGYGEVESLSTRMMEDIGLSGDDNLECLERFVAKFELDYSGFEYKKHFHTEAELYDSLAALCNLMALSVWLPLKTIELLTFNRVKIDKPNIPVLPNRVVSDLTFKDLVTWYIEKEFKQSKNIQYVIKPTELGIAE